MPNELNQFATFKPIEIANDSRVQEARQYYQDNGLVPDNPFMTKFLDQATTTQSIPNISTPSKDMDIAALLANKLTKAPLSTPEKAFDDVNVNVANFTPKASVSQKAKEAIKFFMGKGYTKEMASGIAGNLYAESGLNHLRPQNNGGPGFGLAQWEGPRQAHFKQVMGKDVQKSTAQDQLEFINWELNNTEKGAKLALLKTKSPAEAAYAFANKYERMKKYNKEREAYANTFYTTK